VPTLAELRERVIRRADLGTVDADSFISLAELNDYINQALGELHGILVDAHEDWFESQSTITGVASQSDYNLPNDCAKPLWLNEESGGLSYTVKRYQNAERNRYQSWPSTAVTYLPRSEFRYRIIGRATRISPTPAGGEMFTLGYVPRVVALVNDEDPLDGRYEGDGSWDEFLVLGAAVKCLQKEESDPSVLMGEREALRGRIVASASSRDANEPWRVIDVRGGENW